MFEANQAATDETDILLHSCKECVPDPMQEGRASTIPDQT